MAQTLYDKLFTAHRIKDFNDGTSLLWIDRHLIHEVTSAQAFFGLKAKGRKVKAPQHTLAVADHATPTSQGFIFTDDIAKKQVDALVKNCKKKT